MNRTDLFLFESAFARDTYQRVVGKPASLVRCVFNGVTASEFDPVTPAEDATDVVYVGEFRAIKGADLLVEAIARLRADGKPVTLTLAGDGEDTDALKALVARLNMGDAVRFIAMSRRGSASPRAGFSSCPRAEIRCLRGDRGGCCRRADACPGSAASRRFSGPHRWAVRRQQPGAMADAIESALGDMDATRERARQLRERVFVHFSQKAMVEGVLAGYREAFSAR